MGKNKLTQRIVGFIEEKRAVGYKYDSEARMLGTFSRFLHDNYPDSETLTMEIVLSWLSSSKAKAKSLQNKAVIMRELSRYLNRNGIQAYEVPMEMLPKRVPPIPFVFDDDQLGRFLAETDKCCYCQEVPLRHKVMPVFFRLMAYNGLRLTEETMIHIGDVDFDSGVIVLKHTKHDRERQIVVHPNLMSRIRQYRETCLPNAGPDDYLFPGYKGRPMTKWNVYHNFRRFLWAAGISHPGRVAEGKQSAPCVHSLRHTFCVNCIRKWSKEGKNIMAYMPVLQAWLGHVQLSDTLYYLHLTTSLHPDIIKVEEDWLSDIIPTLSHEDDE